MSRTGSIFCLLATLLFANSAAQQRPNVVLMLADDLGYGDLHFKGHPTSSSPNLDDLALNSMVLNNFYASFPLCSPSRASILTGKYPESMGIYPDVFFPDSVGGLQPRHKTLATRLSDLGYATTAIGKWHLGVGVNKEFLPTRHGFDSYLGVPYSQDMCPCVSCFPGQEHCLSECQPEYVSCPLFDDEAVTEQPVDLATLTEKFVSKAETFIADSAQAGKPFFLYLPFPQPHHPQFAGATYRNTTLRGAFGDAVAEMDGAVGSVISALETAGVRDNTLVIFTSDNGPSLMWHELGGCAGLFRCGKGTYYEGGVRVPAMFQWPGSIAPGSSDKLAMHMDIAPTVMSIVNGDPVSDEMQGVDLSPILFGDSEQEPRNLVLYHYYRVAEAEGGVMAVRFNNYKVHYFTAGADQSDIDNYDLSCRVTAGFVKQDPPLLFDLDADPGERYPIPPSDPRYESVVAEIEAATLAEESQVVWEESEILKGETPEAAPCCSGDPSCEPYPACCDCGYALPPQIK